MKFCEECGSVMKLEDDEWVCTQCGHTEPREAEEDEEFVTTERQREAEVIETEQEASFEGKPTATDVTCEECGHHEAWYTLIQTAAADEPPTRFFKCKNCGHTWREYD